MGRPSTSIIRRCWHLQNGRHSSSLNHIEFYGRQQVWTLCQICCKQVSITEINRTFLSSYLELWHLPCQEMVWILTSRGNAAAEYSESTESRTLWCLPGYWRYGESFLEPRPWPKWETAGFILLPTLSSASWPEELSPSARSKSMMIKAAPFVYKITERVKSQSI